MFVKLVELEQTVATAAKAANAKDDLRVYPWRPPGQIQLPAIYNWIDDGSVEVPDTGRIDDIIVVTATIAVTPVVAALDQSLDRLVRLTDIFRAVVDPALKANQPLDGTAKRARRLLTRTTFDEFNGKPAMCMDMLIRVELPRLVA